MIRAAILVALVALGQVNDGDAVVPPSADKPAPAKNDDYSALIAAVEAAVIRIDVQTKDGKAIGSGFVVSDDGVAVTNFHVIEGAKSATVTFRNDAKLEVAGVLAMDKDRDIAILKIKAPGKLDFLSLAPESPKKGESVMAFGAPKGLSFSVTDGIVSAVRAGAELAESGGALTGTWIQTSAPISGGNSGGPLVNKPGKVVGMNTLAFNNAQNINFAISSKDIREVLRKAVGATVSPLSRTVAGSIGSDKNKGDASNDEDEWKDAKFQVNVGNDLTVLIGAARVGKVELDYLGQKTFSDDEFLCLFVALRNSSDTKKLDYRGWSTKTFDLEKTLVATASDELGNSYKRISFGVTTEVQGQLKQGESIYPETTLVDVLVFELPIRKATELRLLLPGEAVGANGLLRLKVAIGNKDKNGFIFNVAHQIEEKKAAAAKVLAKERQAEKAEKKNAADGRSEAGTLRN